ncbi:hypothetical protein H072_11347 [Dactylellina haptotyla CBS 200.50]|uniref:Uncharacterized protein n=1 Tax=Dactylellina haptotyla (strain CBS 200.50) TaxID=1284197 RepID=S8BJ29_DACHA|nr:hypothetical protein H072_11347 [Dactylellina haptotyla CBS 200.50]
MVAASKVAPGNPATDVNVDVQATGASVPQSKASELMSSSSFETTTTNISSTANVSATEASSSTSQKNIPTSPLELPWCSCDDPDIDLPESLLAASSILYRMALARNNLQNPKSIVFQGQGMAPMAFPVSSLPDISEEQVKFLTAMVEEEIGRANASIQDIPNIVERIIRSAMEDYQTQRQQLLSRATSSKKSTQNLNDKVNKMSSCKSPDSKCSHLPTPLQAGKAAKSPEKGTQNGIQDSFDPIYLQRGPKISDDEVIFRPESFPCPSVAPTFPGLASPFPREMLLSVDRDEVRIDWDISAPYLIHTIFNELYIAGKQLMVWVDDEKLCWGTLDNPDVLFPELATMKSAWPRFHPSYGHNDPIHACNESGHCLQCFDEMDRRPVEDFALTMGYPATVRPKGWRVKLIKKKKAKTAAPAQLVQDTAEIIDEKQADKLRMNATKIQEDAQRFVADVKRITAPVIANKDQIISKLSKDPKMAKTLETKVQKINEAENLTEAATKLSEEVSLLTAEAIKRADAQLGDHKNGTTEFDHSATRRTVNTKTADNIVLEFDLDQASVMPKTIPITSKERQAVAKYLKPPALITFQKNPGGPECKISMEEAAKILREEMIGSSAKDTTTRISIIDTEVLSPYSFTSVAHNLPTSVQYKDAKTSGNGNTKDAPKSKIPPPPLRLPSDPDSKLPVGLRSPPPKTINEGTPSEVYDKLRNQRLALSLGIAKFVIDAITNGRKPYFDVSMDGRLEMGLDGDVLPIRTHEREQYPSPHKANRVEDIPEPKKAIKMCTAPVFKIHDRKAWGLVEGDDAKFEKEIEMPNAVVYQDLFRKVEMDEQAWGSFEEKPSHGKKKVCFGSERYTILPTGFEERVYDDVEGLAQNFVVALDLCDEAQHMLTNKNRMATIKEALGEDGGGSAMSPIPQYSVGGKGEKSTGKGAGKGAGKDAASAKAANTPDLAASAATVAEKAASLEDALSYQREELLQLLKEIPPGKAPEKMGFEAHLKEMDGCLKGIQRNFDDARSIVKKTLKDNPVKKP